MSEASDGGRPRRARRGRRGGRRRRGGAGRRGRSTERRGSPASENVREPVAASQRVRSPEPASTARRPRRKATPALPAVPATREPSASPAEAARRLGIEQLHPEQEQVVADVLAGRDVLLVLPTGFGKSACYQVPSMLLPKPVVVVSPLVALLQDQHQRLVQRGIRVVRLDGSVRGRARREALAEIASGGPLLVMTTPETLATADPRAALDASGVSLVAIDEAHCISEWGFDFRPDYRRLGARVRELGSPPILALTATATPLVRESIVRSLGMHDPTVVAASPHRSNLAFEVLECEGDARFRALLRLARRLRRPGIVYCATRREVDDVYTLLMRFGIPAHRYHGGMAAGERQIEQEHFMRDDRRTVMVATSAFGLGIDKRDIRFVMHFQAPASLEQYVQEAGRGGRDGRKANCILLYDTADRAIHELLLSRSRVRPDQLYKLGAALAAWAGEGREPTVQALAVSAELGPRIASALLTKLEEAGLVEWDGDSIRICGSTDTLEQDARALAGQFETLRRQDARRLDVLGEYAASAECRAVFLRRYFGEPDGAPCGLCDACRGTPERSAAFFEPLVRPAQPAPRRGSRRGRGGRARREPHRGAEAHEARPGREPRARRGPPAGGGSVPAAEAGRPAAAAAAGPPAQAGEAPRKRRRRGRRGGRRRRRGAGPAEPRPPSEAE